MAPLVSRFRDLLRRNRANEPLGIYSVCSSHPYAVRAALRQALRDDTLALIESTSNQVNQFGGYTGMNPSDFITFVAGIADSVGYPKDGILFGGDHLGPYPWREMPAREALERAADMVRAYVAAGYAKIHLDVSMYLGDDERVPGKPLAAEIVAERTAELCTVAEEEAKRHRSKETMPLYIVGNEVPVPGGTAEEQGELRPTDPEDLHRSLAVMQKEFAHRGLHDAWERIVGVVVQPGVEFGEQGVHDYDPALAAELIAQIASFDNLVYEAHSTDYQLPEKLKRLVTDHFAILKVGPALTYAFREAVVALEAIEKLLVAEAPQGELSRLTERLLSVMRRDDRFWRGYYRGTPQEIEIDLIFNPSDRIRYYWTSDEAQAAFERLVRNLSSRPIPLTLISQYLPYEYEQIRLGRLAPRPEDLIIGHIERVTAAYARACSPD